MKRFFSAGEGYGLLFNIAILFFITALDPNLVRGQVLLQGQVRAKVSTTSLEGVRVSVRDASVHTFTDQEGKFHLVVPSAHGVLEFSKYDYEPISILVGDRQGDILVRMERSMEGVRPLYIGDSIPSYLWKLPLEIINHPDGRKLVTLEEYQGAGLLVLYFWAPWCTPCVASVSKWEGLIGDFANEVIFLPVHMDLSERAMPVISQHGWRLPTVVGENVHRVNRHFFDRYQVGGTVLIQNGRLLTLPKGGGSDIGKLKRLLAGHGSDFELATRFIYKKDENKGGVR